MELSEYLRYYVSHRPLFLSLIRAKEAYLFQRYLPLPGPVLDVGCGDGFFARVAFSPHPKTVGPAVDVGLDVEESRMGQAKAIGVYERLVSYDGVHMPFPDGSFATVVSNCVLEHIPDLPAVLAEVHRVLKPKGMFLTTVMAKPWEKYLLGSVLLGDLYSGWLRKKQVHLNLLSSGGWESAFARAKLSVVDRVGYLPPAACRWIEAAHYLSLPSLVSYSLMKKWVLWPSLAVMATPSEFYANILKQNIAAAKSGAIFYALGKR